MARRTDAVPVLRFHNSTGQGRLRMNGREFFLGPWNQPETVARYAEFIRQWATDRDAAVAGLASFRKRQTETGQRSSEFLVSVNRVCLTFVEQHLPKYRTSDGKLSAEQDCFRGIIRLLQEHFGELPAEQFGPLRLRALRDAMVRQGWSRRRIRRDNFGDAVKRACRRAKVAPFVPHQLRHTVGTKLTDELGTEAAQRLLGHATRAMTEHYSRAAERQAVQAVKSLDVPQNAG